MLRAVLVSIGFLLQTANVPALAIDPTDADYRRAREIIADYQAAGSAPSLHCVVVVYFTPSDREPAKDWQASIVATSRQRTTGSSRSWNRVNGQR